MRFDANGLEILAREECVRLLGTVVIGRVVTTMRALPVALPVNFAVVDDAIVFRSSSGTKLYAAARSAVVGFQADQMDPATQTGWSVLVVGTASAVDTAAVAEQGLEDLVPRPWAPGPFPSFLSIAMVEVTGRRIVPQADTTTAQRSRRST
ncbi:MAG TPA: pyridoxamine 5'-phosphate oxidase family protein [Nitriliruptorales bacterium]